MRKWAAVRARLHRERLLGTAMAAVAASALAWFGVVGGPSSAQDAGPGAVMSVAGEAPGCAVEDFKYPNADKILAEQNIVLKRGDGHITLADCAGGSRQLEIRSAK